MSEKVHIEQSESGGGTMSEIVFRIQDKDGRGPWKPGFSHKWVETREDHDNLPPWPIEFTGLLGRMIYGPAYGSGCLTLEQLRRWFTPSEYKTLLGYGYQAVRMEVDAVLEQSDIQCVFRRLRPLNEDVTEIELYKVAGR